MQQLNPTEISEIIKQRIERWMSARRHDGIVCASTASPT
jgi:hypothetical protein